MAQCRAMTTQHDPSADHVLPLGKLFLVWVSTIAGLSITEWAAIFALVYTGLNIVVLLRDKFWNYRRQERARDGG